MVNQDIRAAIEDAQLHYWQVAAELGINDGNFSRKLRFELREDEKGKILSIINKLKEGA